MPIRGNMSWGWRKILQLCPLVREHMWYKLSDGSRTSLWFDRWSNLSPLSNIILVCDWYRAGLNASSTVRDVMYNGTWNSPLYLINKYPLLQTIPMPYMDATVPDCLEWRDELGMAKPFCVSLVWSSIRPRNDRVNWFAVVWFASCIPRHAFNLWLVVKQKLKTQDRVTWWDVLGSLPSVCPLCEVVPDSHNHLFF
ncbi:CASP-like protein 4A3 [Tanacetum coccineum]